MHRSVEWSYGAQAQCVVLLLQPCKPRLVTLHLRLQLLEIQIVAISTIEGEHPLGQREQRLDPRVLLIRIHGARHPLLANSLHTTLHHLLRIVPVLAEEARRRRKRIGEDQLFQPRPGKTIDCLQSVFHRSDLGGEVIQLLAGALTG